MSHLSRRKSSGRLRPYADAATGCKEIRNGGQTTRAALLVGALDMSWRAYPPRLNSVLGEAEAVGSTAAGSFTNSPL